MVELLDRKRGRGTLWSRKHGEKGSSDFVIVDNFKNQEHVLLPELLEEYAEDDIYNVDETAIEFIGLLDRVYVHSSTTLSGGKSFNNNYPCPAAT